MNKQGQSLLDFVMHFPGVVMRRPAVSNTEAECLYKIWSEGEKDEYGHVILPSGVDQMQLAALNSKGMVLVKSNGFNNRSVEITKKGEGVIRNIILTTEKSAFEKLDKTAIDYEGISSKVGSNVKVASSNRKETKNWLSEVPWK